MGKQRRSDRKQHAHVEITAPPDMGKMMEFLGSLDPQRQEEFMRAAEEAAMRGSRSSGCTKEEFRKAYLEGRKEFMINFGNIARSNPSMVAWTTTCSWDVKPAMGAKNGASTLTPIMVKDLQVGNTHRGCVLEGKVTEDPFWTGSSSALLFEDLAGDLVKVAVYNVLNAGWETTERIFRKGRSLAIREPFYKVRTDGTLGIRVDDPADITDASAPATGGAWRDKGNVHFNARRFDDAKRCYKEAWNMLAPSLKELSILLSNCSMCRLKDGEAEEALKLACIAVGLDGTNKKAVQRRKEALGRLAVERADAQDDLKKLAANWTDGSQGTNWCLFRGLVSWTGLLPVAADGKDWGALKEEGAAAFKAGRFRQAETAYRAAAARHSELVPSAKLLCNLAAASLETEDWAGALSSSSLAAMLPLPEDAVALASKAWIRRSRALEGLKDPLAPTALAGIDLPEVQAEALKVEERWSAAQKAVPVSATSTAEQYKEREQVMKELRAKDNHLGADEVARIGSMYAMAPRAMKKKLEADFGPLVARAPAKFHEDFQKQHGLPPMAPSDAQRCREILWTAYAHSTTSPWLTLAGIKNGKFKFTQADWLKRFNDHLTLDQYLKSLPVQPGQVLDRFASDLVKDPADIRYSHLIRTSFANHPPRKDIVHLGTVHVAVGFNDLSMLLNCQLEAAPDSREGPLRFVGMDMNPFCVAKSAVLLKMLASPQVPLNHCLQAWYSSSTSRSASSSFKDAALAISKDYEHREVCSYLCHWATVPGVPLSRARTLWLDTRRMKSSGEIASFRRHEDRMAMCNYLLTGDLLGGDEPEVGSLPMWSVPDGSPPLVHDEMAFHAVELDDIAKAKVSGGDVRDCLARILLERLQRLRNWLLEDKVRVELHCRFVKADVTTAKGIAAHRPWTMSWSNMLDYMRPEDFHKLARACSAHGDTMHYGYSMNWCAHTVGANIMDYDDLEVRAQLIEAADQGLRLVAQLRPAIDKLMFLPVFGSALNYIGHFIGMRLYKEWLKHFFAPARRVGPVQIGLSMMNGYDPLAHNTMTATVTWTYDPEVRFHDVAGIPEGMLGRF